jgi:hypothetical protein
MRESAAKIILWSSTLLLIASMTCLWLGWEPFKTYFFLFAWWSIIGILDGWLYLKGGESMMVQNPVYFFGFLVPFSAFQWFVFEAFNLRLQNWHYIHVPRELMVRWAGNFLAFGTVLPGIFLTSNLLEHLGIFRKNEFSRFFAEAPSKTAFALFVGSGAAMLLLPLFFPKHFFPLVWGGFVLLLDPFNARWEGHSLLEEWRQKNMNRTCQLLFSGLICGFLWEFWNFWAGAKWVYSVPLPDVFLKNLRIFEMPVLGFLGFPPFALECFVMTEFANNLRRRTPEKVRRILVAAAWAFMIFMCRMMDARTVKSFR